MDGWTLSTRFRSGTSNLGDQRRGRVPSSTLIVYLFISGILEPTCLVCDAVACLLVDSAVDDLVRVAHDRKVRIVCDDNDLSLLTSLLDAGHKQFVNRVII